MTMTDLEGVPTFLTEKIIFHNVCADPSAPKVGTELTGATAFDASQHIRMWNPQRTENNGTRPGKQGRGQDFPTPGKVAYTPIEIRHQYDPQGAPSADLNKLATFLVPGSTKFVTVRKGLPIEVALQAAQRGEVWRVRCGVLIEAKSSDDEYGEYEYVQMLYPQRVLVPSATLAA